MIKYYRKDVVFQEVPGEISLSFSIAGCPYGCKHCSWENINIQPSNLELDYYKQLLVKYKGLVSCVLFLGGDWDPELLTFLKIAKDFGYKTCLYTGNTDVNAELLPYLDYIKTGPYIEELGGLTSKNTNQKFIKLETGEVLNKYFIH